MAKELDIYDDDDGMMDTMMTTMFMVIMLIAVVSIIPSIAQAASTSQGTLALGLNEPYNVTATVTVQSVEFDDAMQSVVVHNDGGFVVYVKLNDQSGNANILNSNETIEFTYNTHVIERVFYYTLGGQSGIRIIGTG